MDEVSQNMLEIAKRIRSVCVCVCVRKNMEFEPPTKSMKL